MNAAENEEPMGLDPPPKVIPWSKHVSCACTVCFRGGIARDEALTFQDLKDKRVGSLQIFSASVSSVTTDEWVAAQQQDPLCKALVSYIVTKKIPKSPAFAPIIRLFGYNCFVDNYGLSFLCDSPLISGLTFEPPSAHEIQVQTDKADLIGLSQHNDPVTEVIRATAADAANLEIRLDKFFHNHDHSKIKHSYRAVLSAIRANGLKITGKSVQPSIQPPKDVRDHLISQGMGQPSSKTQRLDIISPRPGKGGQHQNQLSLLVSSAPTVKWGSPQHQETLCRTLFSFSVSIMISKSPTFAPIIRLFGYNCFVDNHGLSFLCDSPLISGLTFESPSAHEEQVQTDKADLIGLSQYNDPVTGVIRVTAADAANLEIRLDSVNSPEPNNTLVSTALNLTTY